MDRVSSQVSGSPDGEHGPQGGAAHRLHRSEEMKHPRLYHREAPPERLGLKTDEVSTYAKAVTA